jgi:hypothetical protein
VVAHVTVEHPSEDFRPSGTAWLAAYVDLPLGEVLAALRGRQVDQMLASVAAAALGPGVRAVVHADVPVHESRGHAVIPLSWTLTWQNGHTESGSGSLSCIVVWSGAEPITELLAVFPVDARTRRRVVEVTRKLLDLLALRLEQMG